MSVMAIAFLWFSLVGYLEGRSPQQSVHGRGNARRRARRDFENFGRRISLCITKCVNEIL